MLKSDLNIELMFYLGKEVNHMLNIFYGDMEGAVYNTASYFKYDYEDDWIIDPFVKEMIQDVDQSTVLDSGVIDSPILGKIPPVSLSGGVKTLILVKFEKDKIFNVNIAPYPYLIPAMSIQGEKYVRSVANGTSKDNLLMLPRE